MPQSFARPFLNWTPNLLATGERTVRGSPKQCAGTGQSGCPVIAGSEATWQSRS